MTLMTRHFERLPILTYYLEADLGQDSVGMSDLYFFYQNPFDKPRLCSILIVSVNHNEEHAMQYLMIQNPGEAPVEGYTILGLSTTRDSGVKGTIGQFGSGSKHAINVLLRAGLDFFIYCGKTRLRFFTETRTVNDGLVEKSIKYVMCEFGGTSTKTIDCGWCLDFGSIDWDETSMAIREFVSNALDRTIRERGEFLTPMRDGDVSVIPVGQSGVRARAGFTRIYIEMTDDVQTYYGELPKRFLHFSRDPSQISRSILPKSDRNLTHRKTPMIYRNGVLVREITDNEVPSLFDYNFTPEELSIDECRNSSEYNTRGACSKLIRKASASELAKVYKALIKGGDTFEGNIDSYYVLSTWDTPSTGEKQTWKDAWEMASDGAILCDKEESDANQFVSRKGHAVKEIESTSWFHLSERFGVKTSAQILSDGEMKGREVRPASEAAIKAVDRVWGWLEDLGMTQGKNKPPVSCYRDIMSAEAETMGYYEDGVVYIREDVTEGKFGLKVAFEEVIHYITGATDNSRDFQQFLIDCFVEVAF